ncbi:hypothetical protein [Streptomyces sp. NBC_00258]|uniref:hypothetical protein n=1 Tax=Streptomyces sp. NBC_00258 TaxID=2903642 RepID=UPI002E2C40DB|nr:hypothetical protein [Streptomyces sp. NBC_00258]
MPHNTPTPDEAREALDTASREATEAAGLVESLAERVRDGDPDVTAEQLGAQRQLADLAQLRITAAERKLDAAQKADLDARARATADRIRDLVADDTAEPILDAVRAVMDAARLLVRVSEERHAAIRDVAIAGVHMNEELGRSHENPWPSRDRYGFMAQTGVSLSVSMDGEGSAQAIPAGRVLGVVLRAVLDDSKTRTQATEMIGLSTAGLDRNTGLVPGLAEVLAEAPRADTEG